MNNNKKIAMVLALLVSSFTSQGGISEHFTLYPVVSVAAGLGGDEIGGIRYEEGKDGEVTGGGGFKWGAGLDLRLDTLPYGIIVTQNIYEDTSASSNADVTFSRSALDIVPYIQLNDSASFGVGISLHKDVEYVKDYGDQNAMYFDDATAMVAELRINGSEYLSFGGRAMVVEYQTNSYNGISVSGQSAPVFSGNSVNVFVELRFFGI